MNRCSTRADRPGWGSRLLLLFGAVLLIGMGLSAPDAAAQPSRNICDSLWSGVTQIPNEDCCFRVVLENGQSGAFVDRFAVKVYGATISNAAGPNSSIVAYRNNNQEAHWNFPNGVPGRTDDLRFCIDNRNTNGPIYATLNWYLGGDSTRPFCIDTIEIKCGGGSDSCLAVIEQEIECRRDAANPQNVWAWNFNVRNIGSLWANAYFLEVVSPQGVTISPDSKSVNTPIGPGGTFPRHNATIVGGQPGQTVQVLVRICGSSGPNLDDYVCCERIITIKLPECQSDPCFEIIEQEITCKPASGATGNFEWCFTFRNFTNQTVNRIYIGNTRYNIAPVQPQGTGNVCVTLSGTPGSATAVMVNLCREDSVLVVDSATGRESWRLERQCCEKRVEIKLPECGEEHCFEIVESQVFCDSTGRTWWCFKVRNQANWAMGQMKIEGAGQSTLPPYTLSFTQPVEPGAISQLICHEISSLTPGRNMIEISNCSERLNLCCSEIIELVVPDCKPHGRDCCDGFEIGISNIAPVAAPNGLTGLLGSISAGQNNITKATATIVSSTINGQPAYGYFNSGTILNPLGNGIVVPPPFGQQLVWNANTPGGINMNTPSLTLEWLRFPPMAPNARKDTLAFCIRWQFTDAECRTCDTIVCYRVIRNRTTLLGGSTIKGDHSKGASIQGSNGLLSGELNGANMGSLLITLPELSEAEYGQVTYTGITLQADEGVRISNVTASNATFSTQLGLAIADINGTAGTQYDLDITYENLDSRQSLGHFLLLGFESSKTPGIQQQLPLNITLRQAGIEAGGDKVEAVKTEIQGARVETFAIHVRNANTTSEPLNGMRITTGAGVKILAVGPTSSETEALLRFGAAGEGGRPYISEASEGTVQLPPGAERKPIYLTVSYDGELSPLVHYETLNSLDETVSEGDLDLGEIASIRDAGDATGSNAYLGESRPNPTTGTAAVTLSLTQPNKVNLVLRDSRGREVLRLIDNEALESGSHVVTFDVSDLASGVYFYTLETPTGTETRKLTVQK